MCIWKEEQNNKDWFYVGCIKSKVNIWKLARKKNLTMIQIFQSCPYCKDRVKLEGLK